MHGFRIPGKDSEPKDLPIYGAHGRKVGGFTAWFRKHKDGVYWELYDCDVLLSYGWQKGSKKMAKELVLTIARKRYIESL